MANEYLTRTPTSCGNRHVHTVSVWAKVGNSNTQKYRSFFAAGSSSPNARSEYGLDSNGKYNMGINDNGSLWHQAVTTALAKYSDGGNWMHFCVSVNSTLPLERDRIRFWINGSIYPYEVANPLNINANTPINDVVGQYIGRYVDPSQYWDGELSDFFLVDGQALTPDVFGFYKQGKGYQSSGTTKATDFRPGQWSPHSPRTIKNAINRTGGFGVNGIYLPMNDSSNFGADFHTTPNSIIKLKGEDLPQPRNGLPTTSDNYVSQLRSDPYAANLVLAVPGVNTQPTGSELVTNGTFDTDVSGWTITDTGTIVRQSDGTAKVTRGSSARVAYQDITTVVGTTYELSVDITAIAGSHGQIYVYSTDHGGNIDTNIGYSFYTGTYKGTFTADTTTTRITLYAHPSGSTSYDNVSVKATTIRDYHADIKGSGTNKTLTVNGAAGIRNNDTSGSAVNGYYGSALTFGSSNYFDAGSSSDFDFGSGDFTIEYWQNSNSFASTPGLGIWDNVNNQRSWLIYQNSSGRPRFYVSTDGTSSVSINSSLVMPTNQWIHFCMERNGSNLVGYVNGVCVGVNRNLGTQSILTPADPFLIGKWDPSGYYIDGVIQDLRVYKGVAKYKGGFDVPKPYNPVGIESWRQVPDTCNGNNFATFNPSFGAGRQDQLTYSNGNLRVVSGATGGSDTTAVSTMAIKGKIYCEFALTNDGLGSYVGVMKYNTALTINGIDTTASSDCWLIRGDNEHKSNGEGVNGISYGSGSFATGDIIMVAVDIDNTSIWFGKNGTWYASGDPASNSNAAYTNLPSTEDLLVMCGDNYSSETPTIDVNFGQNPTFGGTRTAGTYTDANGKGLFKYQPPAGYLALCEDNLPTPAIADPGKHFKTLLWTGDGRSYRSITGCGFTPDFVWIKVRNAINSHYLFDTIRGADKALFTDLRDNENDYNGSGDGRMPSFDPDGFTVSHSSSTGTNESDDDYVAWCWKAGGPAVTNNDGSIAAQISVNRDAGFSILSYTGNGTSGTVGHGLGKTPNIVICKNRSDDLTNWSFNGNVAGLIYGTNKMVLQGSGGIISDTNEVTSANATTITLGNSSATNDTNDAQIAYCWTEISGFSKFGSYTGIGGSDGTFINCGFKPAFLMIKRTDSTGEWWMYDSSRGSTNPIPRMLMANFNVDEQEDSASYLLDFVSNGFKWRSGLAAAQGNGNTYLFMAFAESPLQTANAK